jgi:hypothetical protein
MKLKFTGVLLFILAISLTIALVGCSYSCDNHEYVDGNCKHCHVTDTKFFEFTLMNDDTYSIKVKSSYTNDMPSEVKIPEVYEGKAVTQVGLMGFSKCEGITKVVMPDSITTLSTYAFSSCTSLTEVKLSKNLTHIASRAFSDCTELNKIKLPKRCMQSNSNR